MTKIYSIIPWLKNEVGHNYEYNLSIEKAAKINGWDFCALIPKKCQIENLKDNWMRCLANLFLSDSPSFFRRLFLPIFNLYPFLKILRKVKIEKDVIFLMEHFGFLELLVFKTP